MRSISYQRGYLHSLFHLGKRKCIFASSFTLCWCAPLWLEHCTAASWSCSPSVHPDVALAAHPTLAAAKPSQPYGRAEPGLCPLLLRQLNKSAVSGLRAVVAGAVRVNATHI